MPGGFNSSLREYSVSEPHNSHFSVVQVTWTSPNYRFTMLHFEQRSALKCCISERCQFSTSVKWHCFIGPNLPSAILSLLQRKHADSCTPVRACSLHAHSHSSWPAKQRQPLRWGEHSGFTSPSFLCKKRGFSSYPLPPHTDRVRRHAATVVSHGKLVYVI